MKECEEKLRSLHSAGPRDWQVAEAGTNVKHVEELKSHANYCTIG